MSLAKQCFGQFNSITRDAGRRYFKRGDVELTGQGPQLQLAVHERNGRVRQVTLFWSEEERETLVCECSCDKDQAGEPCKHIWACFLFMDQQQVELPPLPADPHPTTPNGRHVSPVGGGPSDAATEPQSGGQDLERVRRLLSQDQRNRPRGTDWKRVFDETRQFLDNRETPNTHTRLPGARQRRGWYVIDVRATMQAGELAIDLYQQDSLKNGQFGKIKTLSVSPFADKHFTDPREDELLEELELLCTDRETFRYRPRYYSAYGSESEPESIQLDPGRHGFLLPKLAATGRFCWYLDSTLAPDEAQPIRWDDGEPWRFRPRIKTYLKRRQWRIRGTLYRGDEEVALDEPVLVLVKGLVLFPDRLAPCDVATAFPWIRLLRQQSEIVVSFDEKSDLIERLWTLPNADELQLPKNLRWPQTRSTPRGALRIHAPQQSGPNADLTAEVGFRYGKQVIGADERCRAVIDREQRCVIVRDQAAESGLWEQLRAAGFRAAADQDGEQPLVRIFQRELPATVKQLIEAGWDVEAEGQKIRRPGECRMSVRSSVDWFELDAEFDFDGVSAELPALLKAVKNGEHYVKLSDGSRGLLPEAWLERYGRLADLAAEEDGALRFRHSQAALLDALLSSQEQQARVQVDQTFADWCDRLRSFEGIEACATPDDFTGTLRDYQSLGLSWLRFLRDFRLGGCLADDMGLGKTIQVLALLEQCRSERTRTSGQPVGGQAVGGQAVGKQAENAQAGNGRQDASGKPASSPQPADGEALDPPRTSLVVAPRSLVYNWLEEAARFTPQLKTLDYTGTDRKEALERLDEYDVVVTTYGTLRRDILQLKDKRFRYAILDESQAIKNAQSQSAKACRLLAADHRLAMTGTPVENHLGELWSLFEFLNPGLLGTSTAFQRLFKSTSADNPESLRVLSRALSPFILRRTKQEVLTELPEKTEQTLHCEMPAHQRKHYEELRDFYRGHLAEQIEQKGLQQSKIHVLEALLRLRQAACHPGLLDERLRHKSSAKLDALLEQLDRVRDEGHKALVFSQFTTLLSIVRERLDKQGIRYTYLDGRTRDREQRVREFQEDPECGLFLISLKAGGFGLNLTAAEYVFILDPWWNPAVEAQAVDRAHRIGQTRPVFAYRLICQDTVEQRILELQQTKRELAEAIVSANSNVISQLTADDLQALLS